MVASIVDTLEYLLAAEEEGLLMEMRQLHWPRPGWEDRHRPPELTPRVAFRDFLLFGATVGHCRRAFVGVLVAFWVLLVDFWELKKQNVFVYTYHVQDRKAPSEANYRSGSLPTTSYQESLVEKDFDCWSICSDPTCRQKGWTALNKRGLEATQREMTQIGHLGLIGAAFGFSGFMCNQAYFSF